MALNKHYVERTGDRLRLVLQRWDGRRLQASMREVEPAVLRDRQQLAQAWRHVRAVHRESIA